MSREKYEDLAEEIKVKNTSIIFLIIAMLFAGELFAKDMNEPTDGDIYTPYQVPVPNGIAINLEGIEKHFSIKNHTMKIKDNVSACWTCRCRYIPGTLIYTCRTCCK